MSQKTVCTECGSEREYLESELCDECDTKAFEREWLSMTEEERWQTLGETREEAEAMVHRTVVVVETMIAQARAGLPIVRTKAGKA